MGEDSSKAVGSWSLWLLEWRPHLSFGPCAQHLPSPIVRCSFTMLWSFPVLPMNQASSHLKPPLPLAGLPFPLSFPLSIPTQLQLLGIKPHLPQQVAPDLAFSSLSALSSYLLFIGLLMSTIPNPVFFEVRKGITCGQFSSLFPLHSAQFTDPIQCFVKCVSAADGYWGSLSWLGFMDN